ncbi:anthranilate phosphoribosyltransferase [Sulfuritalea hydrogenivorans]|uniref:Anthranilate phosphoribosyltransferase n=1 Tax=Sulfuritalea hydrogenivorans sk43H TaxID=1223802 RepID=W0SI91_9PROT|nr:anthranilate phosphoribosyltransferase [Sulfuritalea hydrogenivorans]MDK9714276.1 anthranilate phosphoribosyltransferase [Sulfuritalea sp.]BAO30660.1 anthranilate phosphoribosyltransferase [Sulfuritalea hydrogenivorans sk43H]
MITPQEALQRTIEHREIFHDEMLHLMRQIMKGEITPLMVAAILTGLRVKKETIGEISAAAMVMRELSTKVDRPHDEQKRAQFVDIVGTGGDGAHTFNISTASMFVAAAAGATVAKHGNRSVSSKSGSADVLEALGAKIDLAPQQVGECIETIGCGFMFAPNHHPAMKNVAPVRREMAVRTIFNILGPLTNPAGAPNTLMGVFHPDLVGIQVRVMQQLGANHVLVVWGKDGMDEISLGAATLVGELKDGKITEYEIHPEDFGLAMVSNRSLRVADATESKAMLIEALENTPGTPREIVTLNAGAALYTANRADSIGAGIAKAREAIASGAARKKLDEFVAFTRKFA